MDHLEQGMLIEYLDRLRKSNKPIDDNVKSHIDGCADCQRELALLQKIDEALLEGGGLEALHPDQATIASFLDKKLDPREKAIMEDHLSTCYSCKEEIAELLSVVDALTDVKEIKRAKENPAPQPTRDRFQWLAPNLWAFAMGLLLLVVMAFIKWPILKKPESGTAAVKESKAERGFGFTERGPILYNKTVLLTEDLQKALLAHYEDKNQERLTDLIDLILKQDREFPATGVLDVVVPRDTLEAMQADNKSPDTVILNLYKNGELEIVSLPLLKLRRNL